MPRLPRVVIGLTLLILLAASGERSEAARKELARRNIAFRVESLFAAARQGDASVVTLLLTAGMSPNAKDRRGTTALIWAAEFGHTATAKLLLDRGADVQAQTTDTRWTALMLAASRGHADTVRLLLEHGAGVHAKTKDGRTALMLAVGSNHTAVMQLLKRAGAKE